MGIEHVSQSIPAGSPLPHPDSLCKSVNEPLQHLAEFCCPGARIRGRGAVAPARSEVISRLIAAEGSRTFNLRPVEAGSHRPPERRPRGSAAAELCRSPHEGSNEAHR